MKSRKRGDSRLHRHFVESGRLIARYQRWCEHSYKGLLGIIFVNPVDSGKRGK